MTHPSRLDIFRAWAKAMELGAIVGKPNYGNKIGQMRNSSQLRKRKRKQRKARRRNGKD